MKCDLLSNQNNLHFMLDIETLGTEPDSIVTELGIYTFSKNDSYIPASLYGRIGITDQIYAGRTVSSDTLKWHFEKNSVNFLEYIDADKSNVDDALVALKVFVEAEKKKIPGCKIYIWANSPIFDIIILKDLYKSLGYPIEETIFNEDLFKYQTIMDYRTITKLINKEDLNLIKEEVEMESEEGSYHNALYDAIHQSKVLMKIAHYLGD